MSSISLQNHRLEDICPRFPFKMSSAFALQLPEVSSRSRRSASHGSHTKYHIPTAFPSRAGHRPIIGARLDLGTWRRLRRTNRSYRFPQFRSETTVSGWCGLDSVSGAVRRRAATRHHAAPGCYASASHASCRKQLSRMKLSCP